jgi:hypothetical protein
MTLKRQLLAALFIAMGACAVVAQPAPAVPAPTPDAGVLERMVVLGSSASAGFRTPATLNLLIEPMITAEHEPVQSAASSLFFLAPEKTGESLAVSAADHDPTLVIALDYLFWFGYGEVRSENARLELLELGLGKLERFDCPVIVSPYPVVTKAIGKILSPAQVPAAATLERLDARVEQWVAENPNVYIVSVPEIYAQLQQNPPSEIAGQEWPRESGAKLMQSDFLHPTIEGMVAVSALVLQDLVRQGLIPADSVELDMAACLAEASGVPQPTPEEVDSAPGK